MQNLLPLLALQPERVVQVRSHGSRFELAEKRLEHAARVAGNDSTFKTNELASEFPDFEEVRQALEQLLSVFPDSVVNVTGGTKLMSIGAFLGASEFRDVPLLYCDTDQQQFRSIGSRALPEDMPSFDRISSKLTVPIVMAAHGKSPEAWRYDHASDVEVEFGARAFSIRSREYATFNQLGWSRHLRAFFRNDKGRIPKGRGKLDALTTSNILDAFPEPLPSCAIEFIEAAVEAQFLRTMETGHYSISASSDDRHTRSHVEKIANILDGSWIELFILHVIRNAAFCTDPHWSVEPLKDVRFEEARDFGETDIVFLKWPRGNLHVVSCKTTLDKPLEHIESLHERSRNLGGRYARAMLYVLHVRDDQRDELLRWGQLLDVKILIGNDIFREFGVDPKRYV